MNDDEPLIATINDPLTYTKLRGRTTQELGSTMQFHADCPCCGYRFGVDHSTAQQSLLSRTEQTFKRRIRDKIQAWFTDCWKWKTHNREFDDGKGKNKSGRIKSTSVDAVIQTSAGPGLIHGYKRAARRGYKLWFAVLWQRAPVIGEMFFACKLGDLFAVLQGIADDSPEFAYRLRLAADNALKRDGSAARGGRHGELAPERGEGGSEPFDQASAVRV